MSNMNDELAATLGRFSEAERPISEIEIATGIRVLRKEDDTTEPPLEWLAELMAFEFHKEQRENNPWGTYYGPLAVWNTPDGIKESPSITEVTPEMLNYWERRAQEAKNPVMKARYADLVWDFSKRVTGKGADVVNAQTAIDSIILIALKKSYEHDVFVVPKLERALGLVASIGDDARIARVAQTILDFEEAVAEDDKPGLWGFSYDLLWNNKRVNLNEERRNKILSDLESRLQRVSDTSEGSTPDPWVVQAAALRLASAYRKENRPNDVRRVLNLYGRAFQEHCKSGTPLQISFWLQGVHSVFLQFGLRDEAERITQRLREIGPKVANDMKLFSHKMEISKEEIDRYLDAMTEGDLETVLQRIAAEFIPRKDTTENQVRDIARAAPLSFLVTKQIQDHQGRPVAAVGSLDEDLEGNLVYQMSQNMRISAVSLNWVLKASATRCGVSPEILLQYLYQCPLFQEDRKEIIRAGLDAYFNNSHLVAVHLLTPQIEAAIRNLIEMTGGIVLKARRDGGFHLRTLDELLRDEQIKAVFGEDVSFYLRVLLTDQRGWNLRNNVCHGIMPIQYINEALSDRIIHVLLCLALVYEKVETDRGT